VELITSKHVGGQLAFSATDGPGRIFVPKSEHGTGITRVFRRSRKDG
jgi:hypothetical protein